MSDDPSGSRLRPATVPRPDAGTDVDADVAAEFLHDEPGEAPTDRGAAAGPDAADVAARPRGVDGADPPSTSGPLVRHARGLVDDRGPGFLTRMIAVVLAVAVGLAGGVVALVWLVNRTISGVSPFDENTVDRSGTPVLQSLNDLSVYQAASGYYEIVIDQETEVENLPSFLAGERVVFVAAGTVAATVDFSGLDQGNVTTDDGRTSIAVSLPAVQLGTPQLDLDRSYVAGHQRGLRERIQDLVGTQGGGQNTEELYRVAEQRLAEAGARTDDLRQRARDNTRSMLTALLTQAGYTQVTVSFADE